MRDESKDMSETNELREEVAQLRKDTNCAKETFAHLVEVATKLQELDHQVKHELKELVD